MRIQNRELCAPPVPFQAGEPIILGPAIRYGGQIIVGGQQYFAEPDEYAWVASRLIYNPDRNYSGFWAMRDVPLRAGAGNLSIAGGTYRDIAGGGLIDTVSVPAGAPLSASWSTIFGDTIEGDVTYQSIVKNAVTGATVNSQFSTGNKAEAFGLTIPALAAGSYLWHVRITEAARAYVWPPPDYEAITGRPTNDIEFSWIHPTIGRVFYNPYYHVGLYPYDPDNPLRLLHEVALAAGDVLKVPDWVSLVTTADEAGNFETTGGEYSSLRVIAGAGTSGGDGPYGWIGDGRVVEAATAAGACLWKAATPGPGVVPAPWILDPTARIGGAFYIEPEPFAPGEDGALWVALQVGGRNGRTVRLLRLAPDLSIIGADGGGRIITGNKGNGAGAVRWCECALSNEAPNSIARYPDRPLSQGGRMHLLTFCSRLLYQPTARLSERLQESHPGGRSFTLVGSEGGDGSLLFHTERDFASSLLHTNGAGFNHILGDSPRGPIVGPGSAHHNYDNLAAWNGDAYYIAEEVGQPGGEHFPRALETDAEVEDNNQFLTRYDGGAGVKLATWKPTRFDMGPLSPAGPNMVIAGNSGGVPGATMYPAAFRFTGDTLQRSDYWPLWVRRIGPSLSADGLRQVAIATGYKEDRANPGTPLDGMYVYETTGEAAKVTFTCSDPDGAPCPCVCVPITELIDQGYTLEELPPVLVWDSATGCWHGAQACIPGAPCLTLTIGEATVCYCIDDEGDWPYSTEDYPSIELTDLEGCWPPVGPTPCSNPIDCLPVGWKVSTIQLPDVGEVFDAPRLTVIVAGRDKSDPDANQWEALKAIEAANPSWLWLAVDVDTPIALDEEEVIDPATEAFLRGNFITPARLGREVKLPKPARRNVVLCYMTPPGARVVMALAPR